MTDKRKGDYRALNVGAGRSLVSSTSLRSALFAVVSF